MASVLSPREFERAFHRHHESFIAIAIRLNSTDPDTAEDLVCEARLTAFQLRGQFLGSVAHDFRRWAGRIVSIMCQRHRRKASHIPLFVAIETLEEQPAPQGCPEIKADLLNALDALPPYLRAPLDLHLNGYCISDIAATLRIRRNTVSNRLEEAGQRLRVSLPGFEPEVNGGLLTECSEHATYQSPQGVWDHRGTSRQIESRRYCIRVTNGFVGPPNPVTGSPGEIIWFERPDILQPLPASEQS
jgi:RNA polymerase sigma factor (sigma-70 family)